MDFSEGIPPGNRTMVVVPALLENAGEIAHLLQEMELRYLSNPDPQLTYALLTDFSDAAAQLMPEDDSLLALAKAGIEALNKKYSQRCPFYLFHRQREWNASEGVWMGWERKRGKLAEFNRLLLGLGETSYTTQEGNSEIIHDFKYVITLDADTQLPHGSAERLVGTIAHPLNRVELTAEMPLAEVLFDFYDCLKSVTQGYGSFDYTLLDYRVSDVVKVDILVATEKVDALSFIVHRDTARPRALAACERLAEEIPRQQFKIAIQGAIGGHIIARTTITAYRKDVTAKCYGGDISRKRKLLEKQKEGKKRMKRIGKVDIPQEAFLAVLRIGEDAQK